MLGQPLAQPTGCVHVKERGVTCMLVCSITGCYAPAWWLKKASCSLKHSASVVLMALNLGARLMLGQPVAPPAKLLRACVRACVRVCARARACMTLYTSMCFSLAAKRAGLQLKNSASIVLDAVKVRARLYA